MFKISPNKASVSNNLAGTLGKHLQLLKDEPFISLPGYCSSAPSTTDSGNTYRISGLGEVSSVVYTKLYHSADAVLIIRGGLTQDSSC